MAIVRYSDLKYVKSLIVKESLNYNENIMIEKTSIGPDAWFSDVDLGPIMRGTRDSSVSGKGDGEISHALGSLKTYLERIRNHRQEPNVVERQTDLFLKLVESIADTSHENQFGSMLARRIIATRETQKIAHDDALSHFEIVASHINDALNAREPFGEIKLTETARNNLDRAEAMLRGFVAELRPKLDAALRQDAELRRSRARDLMAADDPSALFVETGSNLRPRLAGMPLASAAVI